MKAIGAVDEKDSNKAVGVIKSFFGKAFLHFFFLQNTFFLRERTCAKKECNAILLLKLFFLRKGLC